MGVFWGYMPSVVSQFSPPMNIFLLSRDHHQHAPYPPCMIVRKKIKNKKYEN